MADVESLQKERDALQAQLVERDAAWKTAYDASQAQVAQLTKDNAALQAENEQLKVRLLLLAAPPAAHTFSAALTLNLLSPPRPAPAGAGGGGAGGGGAKRPSRASGGAAGALLPEPSSLNKFFSFFSPLIFLIFAPLHSFDCFE